MQMGGRVALVLLMTVATTARAQADLHAEAVRLNNRGVAQMGQQFTERAADSFADALKKDPKLAQAAINEGIALLTLQRLDDAKKALQQAIALEPNNAQAWYNLGLALHAGNELEPALASFQQAVKIDPRDADSTYFEGVCYQEMKEYDKAIAIFQKALEIDPLHASAEFQLARALQRSGRTADAKEHFKRFQHLTSAKIGAPIGLSYGEQGHYSTVMPVEEPEAGKRAMIPLKMVARPIVSAALPPLPQKQKRGKDGAPKSSVKSAEWTTTGGACMMDVTGEGRMDLVLMQAGAQSIRVLHNKGDGSFEEWDAAAAGLKASGHAVACAVGDYDGDGLNDLAVALDDAVLLFRNLGHGKFQDVTAEAGLKPMNRPTGITFIDYDHDGDLDLLLSGSEARPDDNTNILWRNNGNKTFTEWTEPGMG